ncbi:unnamed protein product [Oppiella nova]|uniref:Uncharacterized protein n=2 Tax=Oppiella nova TaxID=334625 RepID=A0A7R9QCK1_9ACAR|nr:unnamed protein product [Oppiella nova]CAG2162538.1 unnamed protein product [Oppiella nova]
MVEQNLVPYDKHKREYKAPGISLEILNPFRRLRIKFRGYVTKRGSNKLVFLKMRLLWIAMSNVFDFECDHKREFIESELKSNSKLKSLDEIKFENRFEQMGQMKGTFQADDRDEEKLKDGYFIWDQLWIHPKESVIDMGLAFGENVLYFRSTVSQIFK